MEDWLTNRLKSKDIWCRAVQIDSIQRFQIWIEGEEEEEEEAEEEEEEEEGRILD